jgi:diguanylate cyclase (GGDEF)-like protein
MGAVAGAMYLVTPGKAEMRRQAEYNLKNRARGAVRHLDEEPLSTALAAMRPLVLKLSDEASPGLEAGGHPQHVLVVPMQRSGQLMGAMELYLNAWRELTEDQADLLTGVASQGAIAIRHAQLFQAQEENALTDELTKLPNRRALAQRFLQEMQRARRHHKAIAFMMTDLDHFKQVNDTYGHLVGDVVLREAATRLRETARRYDHVGRIGGEEFLIIVPNCDLEALRECAERFRSSIGDLPFPTPNGPLAITVSIGATVWSSEHPLNSDLLRKMADYALYRVKSHGRNGVDIIPHPATQESKEEAC